MNQPHESGRKLPLRVAFTIMKNLSRIVLLSAFVAALAFLATLPPSGQAQGSERLVLSGDTVYFHGLGKPNNCILTNRFKRGEPVGFRMTAINPATGKRDRSTQLVVHLNYNGKTMDLPMRDRQTEAQPERDFWVMKW